MLNQTISAFSGTFNFDSGVNAADISIYSSRSIKKSSKWNSEVERRFKELISLDVGWDGYNGVPVRPANAAFAYQLLTAICDDGTPAAQLVPGSNGDLQIEWHTLRGDIELHILGPYSVHAWYAIVGEDADGVELNLTNDFTEVACWVKRITEIEIDLTVAAA